MTDNVCTHHSDMRLSANHLANCHRETTELFAWGHSEISTAATSGWVGSSAAALEGALEKLRGSAAKLSGRMDHHQTHMAAATPSYRGTDDGSGDEFDGLRPKLLNL